LHAWHARRRPPTCPAHTHAHTHTRSKPSPAEANSYTLKLQPGADAAFVTALAIVCEAVRGKKAAA
jgi:hypothetical protein